MYLDLQDPDSIVNWWREFPERHWSYLDALDRLTPQFRASIQLARQRIRKHPDFRPLASGAATPFRAEAATADPAPVDEDDTRDFAPKYGAVVAAPTDAFH
ncbi:hypothetical protein G8A07_12950 [Roseateles sp. DAIF2]|uniref:hypothetical protein n=1 Tax=Roseateles sp. DAIF2 TaxID=2714952 RepID=UPI0018A28FB3|nr:hypothetical protein [Roseateles sp. DAIF2]QPF73743.1 hypothetical protein G8A07_12950 [Roseateles sp. DAIF2]